MYHDLFQDGINFIFISCILETTSTGCGKFTEWSVWTGCSLTCGTGMKFRRRSCAKTEATDKDCEGAVSDGIECKLSNCTGKSCI